jgi:hypothetical protein
VVRRRTEFELRRRVPLSHSRGAEDRSRPPDAVITLIRGSKPSAKRATD